MSAKTEVSCGCGASATFASQTGWLDAEKVQRAVNEWLAAHQSCRRPLPDAESTE